MADQTTRFTPGPWRIEGPPHDRLFIQDAGGEYVADADHRVSMSESLANARLIAAAPALYASCRELRDALAVAVGVVAESGDPRLNKVFHAAMKQAGIVNGIGVRANEAIRAAEGNG